MGNTDSGGPLSAGRSAGLSFKIGFGLLIFFLLSLIGTQLFLRQTSVGSERFLPGTMLLMYLTLLVVVFVLILLLLLTRQVVKMYFESRQHLPGTKFKVRLLVAFGALSLMPALLQMFLAYSLISRSIDRWFSAPAEQMLVYADSLAASFYQEMMARLERQSRFLANQVAEGLKRESRQDGAWSDWERFLLPYREFFSGDTVLLVLSRDWQPDPSRPWNSLPEDLKKAIGAGFDGESTAHLKKSTAQDVVLCASPVFSATRSVAGVLLWEHIIPQSISFKAYSVKEAYQKYMALRERQREYRWMYMLILALATLVILFGFSWFAVYVAKRITLPIQALAEGAVQVANGDLSYRVRCETSDELQRLVDSFNRMTEDLQENRRQIESAYAQLDERRRYIETLLEHIPSGVISTDAALQVTTVNHAASELLHIPREGSAGKSLQSVLDPLLYSSCKALAERADYTGQCTGETEWLDGQSKRNLAIAAARLDDPEGKMSGIILLVDDFTELIRAEKMAAWQEVARRLAHEFKNPLTPIQLQAEIIGRQARRCLSPAEPSLLPAAPPPEEERKQIGGILEKGTGIILQEVRTLTRLVNEFRQFAQMPVSNPLPSDLHAILQAALLTFEGRWDDIVVEKKLDAGLPTLMLDPDQIKRALVNLVENALTALADIEGTRNLTFLTKHEPGYRRVLLEIADTGCGIQKADQENLFLPYFSRTRKGTGLGLAIVKQIIDEHHGSIRLLPNHPRGARAILHFPVHPPQGADGV